MGIRIGVDIGIASVGLAVVDDEYQVLESVVEIFESADASKNGERRTFRQGKRLLRRRKQRLSDFEELCKKYELDIPAETVQNVLETRVKGLSQELNWQEFYSVLKYMLKHRGISYLEDVDVSGGGSDYLESLANNAKELESKYPCQIQYERLKEHNKYRGENTVDINGVKAHISNVFTSSSYKKELLAIITCQHKLVENLGHKFIEDYMRIWGRKREYYHGPGNEKSRTDYGRFTTKKNDKGEYITEENIFEKLIGRCSIYKEERRAAGASYTAQEFNLLNDLNNISVNGRKLDKEEKERIVNKVKSSDTINMRKIIKEIIGEEIESLTGARKDKDDKEEFHKFEQYNKFRKEFVKKGLSIERFTIEEIDVIAEILTLNTDRDAIEKSLVLHNIQMSDEEREVFVEIRKKNGSMFSKWQSLSIKIMRELIPDLYEKPVNQMILLTELGVFKGNDEIYSKCKEIPVEIILEEIYNPVVKRTIRIAVKAINALIKKYGVPDEIIIEMPRDKNSDEEKKRIKDQQKKNEKEIEDILLKIKSEYGVTITDEHYRNHSKLKTKLRLWNEQEGMCLYSGKPIRIDELLEEPQKFEIDHIIPKSISYDDSRSNKVLVYSSENQDKKNQTPYMYLSSVNREWDFHEFMNRVLELKSKKKISVSKVNNLLFMEDVTKIDVLKGFISRNINDTRYASRVVLNTIQGYFKSRKENTKVKVIKGTFTHELRNALKLEKDREESYAHHGVDAMIMCYSQMGLNTYQKLKETVVDFENEITVNKQKWEDVFNDRAYYECMYQNKLFAIKKNIAIAEKKIKYHHMVDKKCNRGLSKAVIYGTRKYDGGIYKVKKMEIRTEDGIDTFRKLLDGKTDRILMKKNDPITFQNILEIYKNYREAENPFVEYERETGQVIKKYARNGKGCIITKIKYLEKRVNSCIDISHKYGFENGCKRVILEEPCNYRTDVYYNKNSGKYHLVGVKYMNYKFEKGRYVLNEKTYENLLKEEKVIKKGENIYQLDELGIEYKFSLYKNDIIYYEKDGKYFKERFGARSMPQKKNYITTKPIDAKKHKNKTEKVGLVDSECIRKINTDILGNEYWCDKEKFSFVLEK